MKEMQSTAADAGTARIQALNDAFRKTFQGGRVVLTAGSTRSQAM
jgi:hypothetical protein